MVIQPSRQQINQFPTILIYQPLINQLPIEPNELTKSSPVNPPIINHSDPQPSFNLHS